MDRNFPGELTVESANTGVPRPAKVAEGATPAAPAESTVKLDRRDFISETGTKGTETIAPSPEVVAQYQTYLTNHVSKVLELYKADPTSPIFDEKGIFRYEKMLIDQLTKKDDAGNVVIDESKIATGLKENSKLWVTTTRVMEQDIALTLWGLGLQAEVDGNVSMLSRGKSSNIYDVGTANHYHLNINRGRVNTFIQRQGGKIAGAVTSVVGLAGAAWAGSTQAAAATALSGGALTGMAATAAAAGAGAGALAAFGGAGLLLESMARSGVTVDLNNLPQMLTFMQAGGPLKDYLRDVVDLNVDEFQVVGGKVTRRQGVPLETKRVKSIENDLLSKLSTRVDFYHKTLGVPTDEINAIPDNHTLFIRGQVSDHNAAITKWEVESGKERARLIREEMARVGTTDMRTLSNDRMMSLEIIARTNTLNRSMERALLESKAKNPDQSTKTKLGTAAKGYEGTGGVLAKATEDMNEEVALIESSSGVASAQKGKIEGFQTQYKTLQDIRTEVEKQFGKADVSAIEDEVRRRTEITTTQLTTWKAELQTVIKTIEDQESNGKTLDQIFDEGHSHYLVLLGMDMKMKKLTPPLPASAYPGLTREAISKLSVNELLERINKAYDHSSASGAKDIGWSIQSNTSPRTRMVLMQAIAEARALKMHTGLNTLSTDLKTWKTAGIEETFMRVATIEDLMNDVNKKAGTALSMGTPADVDQIKAVMNESRLRYDVRARALREVLQQEDAESKIYNNRLDQEKKRIESEKTRLDQDLGLMKQEEVSVEAFKKLSQVSETYLRTKYLDYEKGLDAIGLMHTEFSGPPPVAGYTDQLDPSLLSTRTVADILTSINTFHTLKPTAGWDATSNGAPDHIRKLITGFAEAKALQEGGTFMSTDTADLAFVKAQSGYLDDHLLQPFDVDKMIDHINGRRRAAGLPNLVAGDRAVISRGLQQVEARHLKRRQKLEQSMSDAKGIGGDLANSELAFLEFNPEYIKAETALRLHKAKLNTGGRVITSSGDLETIIDGLSHDIAARDNKMESIQPSIDAVTAEIDGYTKAYTDLFKKRNEIASRLGGAHTVKELDTMLLARGKYTDEQLTDMKKKLEDGEKALNESDEAKAGLGVLAAMQKDLTEVSAIAPTLNPVYLRSHTVKEIFAEINTAYVAGRALVPPVQVGWPESMNDEKVGEVEQYKQKVIHAIAEARADIPAVIAALPPAEQAALTTVTTPPVGLTYNDILRFSTDEVATRSSLTTAQVELMKKTVAGIVEKRKVAFQQVVDESNKRKIDLTHDTTGEAKKLEPARDSAIAVDRMYNRQGKMLEGSADFFHMIFTDPNFAAPLTAEEKRQYSAGEDVAGLPRGYHDFLAYLTDYKNTYTNDKDNKVQDREETFKRYHSSDLMNPTQLALHLNKHLKLGLGVAPNPPMTVPNLFSEIRARVVGKQLTLHRFNLAMQDMMDDYVGQVLK